MLAAKGRIAFSKDIKDWIDNALSSIYARLEPLSVDVAVASARCQVLFTVILQIELS
jgi:PIN domain nuclease of toxin-antitoxin system